MIIILCQLLNTALPSISIVILFYATSYIVAIICLLVIDTKITCLCSFMLYQLAVRNVYYIALSCCMGQLVWRCVFNKPRCSTEIYVCVICGVIPGSQHLMCWQGSTLPLSTPQLLTMNVTNSTGPPMKR